MTYLTVNTLPELEGKVIKWSAPAYRMNYGFWGKGCYGGFATVLNGNLVDIAGDNIEFAKSLDGTFYFSDSNRLVSYSIFESDIDILLQKKREVKNQCKSLIEEGESKSNYNQISGYQNQPRRADYKSKKEYEIVMENYYKDLSKRYAIYIPFEDKARELTKQFEEEVKNLFK